MCVIFTLFVKRFSCNSHKEKRRKEKKETTNKWRKKSCKIKLSAPKANDMNYTILGQKVEKDGKRKKKERKKKDLHDMNYTILGHNSRGNVRKMEKENEEERKEERKKERKKNCLNKVCVHCFYETCKGILSKK